VATHLEFDDTLRIRNRALFDDNLDVTSNELAVNWNAANASLSTRYTWLESDPDEGRPEDTGELLVNAGYRFDSDWTAGVNWRYDFADTEPRRAGLSLGFENECVDMEFTVSRRYTRNDTLEATTEFGFTVGLNGIGGREGRSRARACRN
jgi:LPS-assembly protein